MVRKSEESVNFTDSMSRIFSEKSGVILIGGKPIPDDLRDILREQAKYLVTSQLWEVLEASTTDEAVNLALIQSKDFSHVEFGKAMWHYMRFIRKAVERIAR